MYAPAARWSRVTQGPLTVGCRVRIARLGGGGRTRRVLTGTLVHYKQTFREQDAASVYRYTGILWANSQGGGCGGSLRVHWYSMSKKSGGG